MAQAEKDGFHLQAVGHNESGALIGLLGLARLNETMRAVTGAEVEIGWQFDKRFWGRCWRRKPRALGWVCLGSPDAVGSHRLYVAAVNRPSQRVMERSGRCAIFTAFLIIRKPTASLRPRIVYCIKIPLP